jgi:hypothetical protein
VSPLGIKNIVRASDCWEIILSKPCGRTYPAGAKVAEGVQSGIVCMYPFRPVKSIPAEWTEYSAVIKGQAKEPAAAQWWPGTKYAKLMITIPANGDSVLFDDISVKELK